MRRKELDMTAYADVPFAEKGRSLLGWDCWGVIYVLYWRLRRIPVPAYTEAYQTTADRQEIGALVNREKGLWDQVPTDPDRPLCEQTNRLQPFDLAVLRIEGEPMHISMYIGAGKIIHCMKGVGTSIEALNSITWRDRIVGYYRHSP